MPGSAEGLIAPTMPLMVIVLILLVAARFGGEIAERLGQPAIVGELLAGILLGPLAFDLIHGTYQLRVIAELGVFFLVFLAGLEMSPTDIGAALRSGGAKVATLGFLIPLTLGLYAGWVLRLPLIQTVFLGLGVSITALPVSLRLLIDTKTMGTPVGNSIVATAVGNDIVALVLLGAILDLTQVQRVTMLAQQMLQSVGEVIAFVLVILAAHRLAKQAAGRLGPRAQQLVLRGVKWFRGQETLFAIAVLFVLVFASIAETLGLHFLIGTFLGAVILSRELLGQQNYNQVKRTTSSVTMGFLAPVFFAHIGLEMSPKVWDALPLLAMVFSAGLIGKFGGGYLGARWAGFTRQESLAVGAGLNCRGTLDLIIATIAFEKNFIGPALFSALVFMGIGTTVVTPWFYRYTYKKSASQKAAAAKAAAKAP